MIASWSVLVALATWPGAAQAGSIPSADYKLKLSDYSIPIRDYQFPSGLRILFEEDHTQPIISITSVIDHGSASDYPGMEGMAHVIEHLCFRAKHGDLPKNMDLIKQLGGSFNASTWDDFTDYMTIAPKDALIPLLKLEAKRISGDAVAGVTQLELDLERDIARNELRQNYENSIGEAWVSLHKLLFPEGHPYASIGIGSHETLDNLTVEAVNKFVKQYYTPENTTIVVVGDFKLDDTGNIIQQVFGDVPHLLKDPKNPSAPIALVESKPRMPAKQAEPPPPSGKGPLKVMGEVERTTVVVGWTMPAGYYMNQISMNVAVNLVNEQVLQMLYPDYDPLTDEIDNAGCFLQPSKLASIAACFAEPSGGMTPERTIEKIGDALSSAWDKEMLKYEPFRQMQAYYFNNSKAMSQASILRSVDEISSIGGGRATNLAHFVHFSANPAFFSYSFQQVQAADLAVARQMAEQYLNRGRMVAVVVEPLSDEEKARRKARVSAGEENASYHGTSAKDEFDFAFDVSQITPETIERVMVVPDRSKIKELTLHNGLKVSLMSYGEAPVVRVGLFVHGDDMNAPQYGLDRFSEALSYRASKQSASESLMQVAGDSYEMPMTLGRMLWAEGSSGNVDAVLRQLRLQVEQLDLVMADKSQQIKIWRKDSRSAGKDPKTWAARLSNQVLFGKDHPLGRYMDATTFDAMEDWGADEIKSWMATKYQPKNANLVVVGKVDAAVAEAAVRKMFDGWQSPKAAAPPARAIPPFQNAPARKIMIFDKDSATQSEIATTCPLATVTAEKRATIDVLGDVVSEEYWRKLREQSAVTYGAYAYSQWWPGGSAVLKGWTLVQNSAVGFGVKTILELFEQVSKGTIDDKRMANAKWTNARTYVLGQQSGSQMLSRLQGQYVNGVGYDFFSVYPKALGQVKSTDFASLVSPCVGHEVITIVGPKEFASKQLDDLKLPYEVVDWEGLYKAQLTPKEVEAYEKAKADKKKKAEEKKAEEKK